MEGKPVTCEVCTENEEFSIAFEISLKNGQVCLECRNCGATTCFDSWQDITEQLAKGSV